MVVLRLRQPELGQDVPDVLLDRSLGEPELAGDAGVRATLGHQRQHLALACREVRERVVAPPSLDQCLHETRVDDRSARRDPPQRVDELVHVQDAALEQVADPIAGREELCRLLDLDMCRQDEDARSRETPRGSSVPRRAPRSSASGGIRMSTITSSGSCSRTSSSSSSRVAGLADDLEAGPLEQAREPFAQEDVVVGHDDPTAAVRGRLDRCRQPYAVCGGDR